MYDTSAETRSNFLYVSYSGETQFGEKDGLGTSGRIIRWIMNGLSHSFVLYSVAMIMMIGLTTHRLWGRNVAEVVSI